MDDAEQSALAAIEAMQKHDEQCLGNEYECMAEAAKISCTRCGELVFDGPLFDVELN
jgi:hypothetical protein